MQHTLIVIDAQTGFYYANSYNFLQNVKEEIKNSIRNKSAILFLEMKPNKMGSTHSELRYLVRNYPMVAYVRKANDCGGMEVLDTLVAEGYNKYKLRICGVNTDICVKETTEKLSRLLPESEIVVIGRACNGPRRDFDWVDDLKNVELENNSSDSYSREKETFSYVTR